MLAIIGKNKQDRAHFFPEEPVSYKLMDKVRNLDFSQKQWLIL